MLTKYEALLTIIDSGGLSSAAAKLGYSQPGISHMLASLEETLGLSLLIRAKNGVSLTSDGIRLLPYIRDICNRQRELMRIVDDMHGVQTGLVRIGAFPSVAINWLPNIIKHFHRDHPRVDFEILYGDYSTIENWIRSGRIDCGFLRYPPKDGLDGVMLGEDQMVAVLPEGHSLASYEEVPVELLAEERFILLREGLENEFTEIFEELNITPKVCFSAWDCQMIAAMVENGLGVSILPELTVRKTPHNIIRRRLSRQYFRKLGIVFRNLAHASVLMKTLLDYMSYKEA
ncbi:MAG: LysR family transcriptional regulator [Synergistaceae bacterium]|nr:LysR family transcriptional regulator [Synergistaceae bacterium]